MKRIGEAKINGNTGNVRIRRVSNHEKKDYNTSYRKPQNEEKIKRLLIKIYHL